MGESKTLILIDGHALAFRQFYALERTNMQTSDGTPTWAVYGFFKAIFDLLKNKDLSVDAIGVAFDVSHRTFRTETYEDYKANREAMPDSMRVQMELIYDGLKAFNIPIYTKPGFEADDVIGTISRRACELGHKVLILTGDQDSFQLVDKDGCVKVIIPSKGELIEYNWDKVYEKLGVYPDQVIDYKALRGDTSDNIPGIKGIGEKTAVKLLRQYKTVENVLANIDSVEGNSLKEKLQSGVEQAQMSKYLATIVRDVDINFDFDKTNLELPSISDVTNFLRRMQFYSFLKNIDEILKMFNKTELISNKQVSSDTADLSNIVANSGNGQLGLFSQVVQDNVNQASNDCNAKIITDSIDFDNMISVLSNSSVISVKLFYDIKSPINALLYGIAFGVNRDFSYNSTLCVTQDGSSSVSYYIPLVSDSIFNKLDSKFVIEELRSILENEDIKKITHDTKSTINVFKTFGVGFSGVIFDTMLASYVKDSSASNQFDIQCMERINHILPTIVSDNKKLKFDDLGVDLLKNYVGNVIECLFKLSAFWIKSLDDKEYKIMSDIEIPLAYVLANMEEVGVSIDINYLNQLTLDFNDRISSIESDIYELAGEQFNINSPKQVANILFDKLALKPSNKKRIKKSTSADVLNELAQEFEIAKLILEYRKFSKLRSTYTEALPALIDTKDFRIHTNFNQTVTVTGRLSSSNPNLQNIPARTEEGNKIRQAFVPKDRVNYSILSADYSQIELRLLAHIAGDENLISAFNSGVDVHTLTASKVFDVPVENVTKDMRYKSKAVNFGIVYGQSKYGLAKSLKISTQEAQNFIDKYFETYPGIKRYMHDMVEVVEQKGYVETVLGRKRYLTNEIGSPNAMIREFAKRAAINHPIQGSASDLIKLAMIEFANKLKENNLKSKMILQVHDELVVEVENTELELVKSLILEAMELNQPLSVPLVVDVNVGDTWRESQ